LTTQPEFSFWFNDVAWSVENYGTDPDIEVENTPQDYAQGVDAQLNRAIQEALDSLERNPVARPQLDVDNRPALPLPQLPPRS
jgi:tricorn protease